MCEILLFYSVLKTNKPQASKAVESFWFSDEISADVQQFAAVDSKSLSSSRLIQENLGSLSVRDSVLSLRLDSGRLHSPHLFTHQILWI